MAPINMILYCPQCNHQHIDRPDQNPCRDGCMRAKDFGFSPREQSCAVGCEYLKPGSPRWDNPPHRSHLCEYCNYTWRPADVFTNGVAKIETRGRVDNPPHDLFKTDDINCPKQICDSNGEVVLALCKRCGKAEAQLEAYCTQSQYLIQDSI